MNILFHLSVNYKKNTNNLQKKYKNLKFTKFYKKKLTKYRIYVTIEFTLKLHYIRIYIILEFTKKIQKNLQFIKKNMEFTLQ